MVMINSCDGMLFFNRIVNLCPYENVTIYIFWDCTELIQDHDRQKILVDFLPAKIVYNNKPNNLKI